PPAFDRQGMTKDDLIDFTPELRAAAEKVASRYRLGPLFTPPSISNPEGTLGTLMLPNLVGGANWPGGALDPETGLFYIYSLTAPSPIGLIRPAPALKANLDYLRGGG